MKSQNTAEISMTAFLLNVLITVTEIESENVLVICEILQLFVNTLTADGKYSLRNSDNLMQLIQMELYEKQKVFF